MTMNSEECYVAYASGLVTQMSHTIFRSLQAIWHDIHKAEAVLLTKPFVAFVFFS